jgi:type I restriction enzyme M protein
LPQSTAQAQNLSSFVWSIAEILRGDFKQSEYGKVILPFVVMRRLDCILEGTKEAVLTAEKSLPEGVDDATRDMILFSAVGGNVKVYKRCCKRRCSMVCRLILSLSSRMVWPRPK